MKLSFLIIASTLVGSGGLLQAQDPLTLPAQGDPDTNLVISLLGQNLSNRTFSFTTVAEACSGKKVYPFSGEGSQKRLTTAIHKALSTILTEAAMPDSPLRKLHESTQVAAALQEAIRKSLDDAEGIKCDSPLTRSGSHPSLGYPGLRVIDEESKAVFYLEPKLIQKDSEEGCMTFEPNNETLKITDDAVHLLVGIESSKEQEEWTFTGWRVVDLSKTKVKLRAQFQASNADIYQKTELSTPQSDR